MIEYQPKKIRYMKKNKDYGKLIQELRVFLKSKKITFRLLSKKMEYSESHISCVFSGRIPATEKFIRTILKTIRELMVEGLKDFYKLSNGDVWKEMKFYQ